MFCKYLVACLWCSICVNAQLEPTESYPHHVTMRSGNAVLKLYWNFNDTDITFEVQGETEGWIGIGFSPSGAMTGADMIVGWVKDGVSYVTDRHGVGNTFPPKDPEQNIHVLAGKECDGWTMFKFTRQLAACEADKDREITASTQRLIYAHGDDDPAGDDITFENYHGTNSGVKSMYFLESARGTNIVNENTEYFDAVNDKFQVPAEETYYNCRLLKLPTLPGKQHVIRFEPRIQKGNEMIVHHIIIHQCEDVLENPEELNTEERCFTSKIKHFETCRMVLVGWTIGAGNIDLPKEAGLPIGGDGDPVYIQIEIHYDNPQKREDIIDSSGIRLVYTSNMRQYDAGIMYVGNIVNPTLHFIPPKAESFMSSAFCPQSCYEKRMNDSDVDRIHLHAVLLHSHLAGRNLRLRHFRNNEELPYIAYDDSYDFNYQESRILDPAVELIGATDHTRMECVYNTEDRTEMTEGSLSTYQEMCIAFLMYYPKIDFGYCASAPSNYESYRYFDIYNAKKLDVTKDGTFDSLRNYEVTAPSPSALIGKTVMEVMSSYNWTEENIDKFSSDVLKMSQFSYCSARNESNSILQPRNYPEIKSEYSFEPIQCEARNLSIELMTNVDTCDSTSTANQTVTAIITTTDQWVTIDQTTAAAASVLLSNLILLLAVYVLTAKLLS